MVFCDIVDIFQDFKSELDLVETELERTLGSDQEDLNEICEYLSGLRGKRFRPLMVIFSYKMVGGTNVNDIIPLASAMELIHTATLVHDDINDNSKLRRGYETVYSKFGMAKALIMGDYLFALGFQLGGSYGKEIVDIVADISGSLAEGEFIHMKYTRNPKLDEETYLDIIERKTAGPIRGGAKIGAIVGKGDPDKIRILGDYGRNIGMAFQIIDDVLDLSGKESELGKPVCTDLKTGKITLPMIHALKVLGSDEGNRLESILSRQDLTDEEIRDALELIKTTDALDLTKKKAEEYVENALEAISGFESHEMYSNLVELAHYTVTRKF